MKKIIVIVIFLLCSAVNSHGQWNKVNSGISDYLFSAFFINTQTGYIGGQDSPGRIYKTVNGGLNWNLVLATAGNERFECLFFINEQTGWAGSYYGLTYKTTNGGANWSYSVIQGRVRRIQFLNQLTGFAVTSQGARKSTNGGLSWFSVLNASEGIGLKFFNTEIGLVSIQNGSFSKIFKTVNGGLNWTEVYNEPLATGINNFSFINNSTGYASGNYKLTLKTIDQGSSWTEVFKDPSSVSVIYDHRVIHFVDANLGYACGQYLIPGPSTYRGAVFNKTTNGGLTWEFQSITPGIHNVWAFEDMQIVDGQIGFVVGSSGNVYKSTNAGFVGIQPISTEIPQYFSLHQNYPNPFNPSTKIKFQIPLLRGVSGEAGQLVTPGRDGVFTSLKIFDILGREVRTLVNENLKPGIYEADFNSTDLPSGVYFYKLNAGEFVATKKMILMK
ncbi:MAG: T9SS type A sorting domain-containing protein [Ignavibacteria bacterium]|nr:T9SS type A sorting domain-containing protein [Ignavibacteria bacterium]